MTGMVFNIQRFSIHDGPGIRTTVFLKGCSLQCFWCHNPESLHRLREVQVYSEKCIGCGKCMEVCPQQAHRKQEGKKLFLRELCSGCGSCADVCYAGALVMVGKHMSAEEVMQEVGMDHVFYENSGGGVTFSGGEPLLQQEFLKNLLIECKSRGYHTAVDTAGNVPWEAFEEIIPYTDLFLYDLKAMDEDRHREATGSGNKLIHDNLRRLSGERTRIIIRVPVIPGVNDTVEAAGKMALFIKDLKNVEAVELLAFHHLGEAKYESLGRPNKTTGLKLIGKEEMNKLGDAFKEAGLPVKI